MKFNHEKKSMEHMRRFLILHFLMVVIFVVVCELLITIMLDWKLFPLLQWYFLKNVSGNSIPASQIAIVVCVYLVEYFLRLLGIFMTPNGKNTIDTGILWIEGYINSKIPALNDNLSVTQMGNAESAAFFGILLICFLTFLLPVMLGAIWYATIVAREVRKLEKQRDDAKKEIDRRRNLMLSDIAHDLRTPITTIAGYSKALADGVVTDERKKQEYLEAIQAKSARMNELIQLLFDYVKLDSDGFRLNRETFDVTELLRQNAALAYTDLEEAGMEMEIDIPEEPCLIYADKIQISRVITNLIHNARKHNSSGTRICLSLRIIEDRVYIAVADTGVEIEPKIAEHIFEPFFMGDESRSSKGGNGLGLSIAHKIIEMHGWKLELVQNTENYTKAFQITI